MNAKDNVGDFNFGFNVKPEGGSKGGRGGSGSGGSSGGGKGGGS